MIFVNQLLPANSPAIINKLNTLTQIQWQYTESALRAIVNSLGAERIQDILDARLQLLSYKINIIPNGTVFIIERVSSQAVVDFAGYLARLENPNINSAWHSPSLSSGPLSAIGRPATPIGAGSPNIFGSSQRSEKLKNASLWGRREHGLRSPLLSGTHPHVNMNAIQALQKQCQQELAAFYEQEIAKITGYEIIQELHAICYANLSATDFFADLLSLVPKMYNPLFPNRKQKLFEPAAKQLTEYGDTYDSILFDPNLFDNAKKTSGEMLQQNAKKWIETFCKNATSEFTIDAVFIELRRLSELSEHENFLSELEAAKDWITPQIFTQPNPTRKDFLIAVSRKLEYMLARFNDINTSGYGSPSLSASPSLPPSSPSTPLRLSQPLVASSEPSLQWKERAIVSLIELSQRYQDCISGHELYFLNMKIQTIPSQNTEIVYLFVKDWENIIKEKKLNKPQNDPTLQQFYEDLCIILNQIIGKYRA